MSLLRSLEGGGCEGWPGGIYSRGYVRGYAEAIGVDPEAVVTAFAECYPAFAPDPPVIDKPVLPVEPQQAPQTMAEKVKAVLTAWFRIEADS